MHMTEFSKVERRKDVNVKLVFSLGNFHRFLKVTTGTTSIKYRKLKTKINHIQLENNLPRGYSVEGSFVCQSLLVWRGFWFRVIVHVNTSLKRGFSSQRIYQVVCSSYITHGTTFMEELFRARLE